MEFANANDPELRLVASDNPLDDEDLLAGVLNDLSHQPAVLHALLDPVPDGVDVAERVLWLRSVVGSGVSATGAWDVYMVAREPAAVDAAALEVLVRQHYASMGALLREIGHTELAWRVEASVRVKRVDPPERARRLEGLEAELHEALSDYFSCFAAGEHPLLALHEAAYSIAASYEIREWVLWPMYRHSVRTTEPFRTAVQLWAAGVHTHHQGTSIAVWEKRR